MRRSMANYNAEARGGTPHTTGGATLFARPPQALPASRYLSETHVYTSSKRSTHPTSSEA
jgi:hypothetical protein